MTGITERRLCLPCSSRLCSSAMGLLAYTWKNAHGETARGGSPVPSSGRPSARVHRQELTFPGEPGVRRKTVTLILISSRSSLASGLAPVPGRTRSMSCGLTLSACTLLCRSCLGIREGSGSGHDIRLCLFSVGCQLPGCPIPCCPFWAASF